METSKNALIKGAIIFSIFAFITYVALAIIGYVLNSMGLSCTCFQYISYAVIALSFVAFAICWYGSCFRKREIKS